MMDYLCNSSRQMMTIVLSGLSQKVTTAGMELLSISSNYQDLMPQFLRGIRILSALYPPTSVPSNTLHPSTPSLTTIPSTQGEVPDRASWSSYVHRVGSNGSVTKGQLPRTSTVSSNASRGHHRSCSQTVMSPDKADLCTQLKRGHPISVRYHFGSSLKQQLHTLQLTMPVEVT
eukprot:Em0392g3a